MLYCLGESAEDVLRSTHISEDDKKRYATVMEQFATFFQVSRNVIFEWTRCNRRNQLPEETAEQYMTTLYNLVENCVFGPLTNKLFRNHLIVGIWDPALSEHFQMAHTAWSKENHSSGRRSTRTRRSP